MEKESIDKPKGEEPDLTTKELENIEPINPEEETDSMAGEKEQKTSWWKETKERVKETITVKEKREEFAKNAWEILNNEEIGNQAAKQLISSLASAVGLKSIYDVPKYLRERFKVRGIFGQGKGLEGSMEELMAASREGKRRENPTEEEETTEKHFEVREAIKDLNSRLKLTREGSEKGSEQRKLIAKMLRENRHKENINKEDRHEEITKILDDYTTTKVTGMQAARESLNTLCTYSGALGIRGLMYGSMALIERGQRIETGMKNEGKEDEKMEGLKRIFVGGVKETYQGALFKGEGTGKQKAFRAIKSYGTLLRFAGIAIGMKFSPGNYNIDKVLDTLEGKTSWTEGAGNFYNNFERVIEAPGKLKNLAENVGGKAGGFVGNVAEKAWDVVGPGAGEAGAETLPPFMTGAGEVGGAKDFDFSHLYEQTAKPGGVSLLVPEKFGLGDQDLTDVTGDKSIDLKDIIKIQSDKLGGVDIKEPLSAEDFRSLEGKSPSLVKEILADGPPNETELKILNSDLDDKLKLALLSNPANQEQIFANIQKSPDTLKGFSDLMKEDKIVKVVPILQGGNISKALCIPMVKDAIVTVVNPDGEKVLTNFDANLVHSGDTVVQTEGGQIYVYKTSEIEMEKGISLEGRYGEIKTGLDEESVPPEVQDYFNANKGEGYWQEKIDTAEAAKASEFWKNLNEDEKNNFNNLSDEDRAEFLKDKITASSEKVVPLVEEASAPESALSEVKGGVPEKAAFKYEFSPFLSSKGLPAGVALDDIKMDGISLTRGVRAIVKGEDIYEYKEVDGNLGWVKVEVTTGGQVAEEAAEAKTPLPAEPEKPEIKTPSSAESEKPEPPVEPKERPVEATAPGEKETTPPAPKTEGAPPITPETDVEGINIINGQENLNAPKLQELYNSGKLTNLDVKVIKNVSAQISSWQQDLLRLPSQSPEAISLHDAMEDKIQEMRNFYGDDIFKDNKTIFRPYLERIESPETPPAAPVEETLEAPAKSEPVKQSGQPTASGSAKARLEIDKSGVRVEPIENTPEAETIPEAKSRGLGPGEIPTEEYITDKDLAEMDLDEGDKLALINLFKNPQNPEAAKQFLEEVGIKDANIEDISFKKFENGSQVSINLDKGDIIIREVQSQDSKHIVFDYLEGSSKKTGIPLSLENLNTIIKGGNVANAAHDGGAIRLNGRQISYKGEDILVHTGGGDLGLSVSNLPDGKVLIIDQLIVDPETNEVISKIDARNLNLSPDGNHYAHTETNRITGKDVLFLDGKPIVKEGGLNLEIIKDKGPLEIETLPDGNVKIEGNIIVDPKTNEVINTLEAGEQPEVQEAPPEPAKHVEEIGGEKKVIPGIKIFDGQKNLDQESYKKVINEITQQGLSIELNKKIILDWSREISVLRNELEKLELTPDQAQERLNRINDLINISKNTYGQNVFNQDVKDFVNNYEIPEAPPTPPVESAETLTPRPEAETPLPAEPQAPEEIIKNDIVPAESFRALDKNPLTEFPQDKLSFTNNFSAEDRAYFKECFNDELEQRREIIKQLAEWKEKYGDQPQFARFEIGAIKELSQKNHLLESMIKMAADGDRKHLLEITYPQIRVNTRGVLPAENAGLLLKYQSRLSGLQTQEEKIDGGFENPDKESPAPKIEEAPPIAPEEVKPEAEFTQEFIKENFTGKQEIRDGFTRIMKKEFKIKDTHSRDSIFDNLIKQNKPIEEYYLTEMKKGAEGQALEQIKNYFRLVMERNSYQIKDENIGAKLKDYASHYPFYRDAVYETLLEKK